MIQLDHINMTVKNLKESVQWYQKVFGFELVETGKSSAGKDLAIIRSGDSMLCLYEYGDLKHPSSSTETHKTYHFGFRIKDRKEWEEIMEKEEVKVHHTWLVAVRNFQRKSKISRSRSFSKSGFVFFFRGIFEFLHTAFKLNGGAIRSAEHPLQ
ncbi:MAG: VOC family protein [Bdellovibrionales bacterium]|nr:VOC family protein [Bdellovibrionales bacterium]NQZ18310.1 VOC family protein [Bdellovibrionales bacterium]